MLKKLIKKFRKRSTFFINKRFVKITPLTFEEMLEVVFLILPYIKTFILAKQQVSEDSTPSDIYFDILHNSVSQLGKQDANRVMCLLLHQDKEFVETLSFKDFQRMVSAIIRENELYETFIHLHNLGFIS
jgi:hypothetical protein